MQYAINAERLLQTMGKSQPGGAPPGLFRAWKKSMLSRVR